MSTDTETRLKRLLDLQAASGEDRFPIRTLFHRTETLRLSYAAVDIGGWLERREVLVSLDRFGAPEDGIWPVSLGREELEAAPAIEAGDGGWGDALPPLVVGPFGYTFSPLLMAAGMEAGAARQMPDRAEPPADLLSRSQGRLHDMERSTDWLGREAFGPDGAMGPIADMVVTDMVLTAAVLEDGTELPLARLRHLAEQGHAVFD